MPLQNRVTPYGTLTASRSRAATLFGNRGCLHDDAGRIVRWAVGPRWIACQLSFKGRRRSPLLQPGRYTELFFLDEATALACGHRPCVECRRADFVRFADAFAAGNGLPSRPTAAALDALLQPERPTRAGALLHRARVEDLPDGTMIDVDGAPALLTGGVARRWTVDGYADRSPGRPSGVVDVITPPSIVRTLVAGYEPRLHAGWG
ncbi:MAG TPA: hypothetical protein VFK42_01240 [Acidimicrobiales bacterium]|nr:hypothetical protein [Acidimicrobiales bacterium]